MADAWQGRPGMLAKAFGVPRGGGARRGEVLSRQAASDRANDHSSATTPRMFGRKEAEASLVDPEIYSLSVQLADTAIRNTASAIGDKITAAKARKKDQETIAELEEIISNLISDKNDLVRIAQAYEQE